MGKYCFNPHTHEGCDIYKVLAYVPNKVSIHTPTKGVTQKAINCISQKTVSIHTPTKGVTDKRIITPIYSYCFNPHTHEGCDWMLLFCFLLQIMFQSTHPRRV